MKRFFTEVITENMTVDGDIHSHLAFSTRSRVGDEIIFCNGDGFDYTYKITKIMKNQTELVQVLKTANDTEPKTEVTLFPAILKGDKLDLVVQKAVELGVSEIMPLITKFVQAPKQSVKVERLNKISLEAGKQCGRNKAVKVHESIEFDSMIFMLKDYDLVVFPFEGETQLSLKAFFKNIASSKKVAVIIGSEGGFSPSEVSSLSDAGVKSVSLGKRILRAETANISVLSIVMYELNELE